MTEMDLRGNEDDLRTWCARVNFPADVTEIIVSEMMPKADWLDWDDIEENCFHLRWPRSHWPEEEGVSLQKTGGRPHDRIETCLMMLDAFKEFFETSRKSLYPFDASGCFPSDCVKDVVFRKMQELDYAADGLRGHVLECGEDVDYQLEFVGCNIEQARNRFRTMRAIDNAAYLVERALKSRVEGEPSA